MLQLTNHGHHHHRHHYQIHIIAMDQSSSSQSPGSRCLLPKRVLILAANHSGISREMVLGLVRLHASTCWEGSVKVMKNLVLTHNESLSRVGAYPVLFIHCGGINLQLLFVVVVTIRSGNLFTYLFMLGPIVVITVLRTIGSGASSAPLFSQASFRESFLAERAKEGMMS
jgi:hypothetical protein